MHSVSDLTTFARRTKGDVPPSLVVRLLRSFYPTSTHVDTSLYRVLPPRSSVTKCISLYVQLSSHIGALGLASIAYYFYIDIAIREAGWSRCAKWSQTCTNSI